MYVIATDAYWDALRRAVAEGAHGLLIGERVDAGTVVRLLDVPVAETVVVGRWQTPPLTESAADEDGILIAVVGADDIVLLRRDVAAYVSQPYSRLSLFADYHARTAGLFDSHLLAGKTATIIGLGTGGGICATELAKAGVGNFRLVDFDRLEAHNIARHVCGLRDMGRLKTDALHDHLRNTNPFAHIECYPFDVTDDLARLEEVVRGSDIVIGATDSEPSKLAINRMAWTLGVPAVYGAAYDMGFGGDVLRVLPPDDACYECFRSQTADMFEAALPEVADYGHITPQPALGLDVSFPALILARVALTILLRDDPTAHLESYRENWVLWGTQPRDGWAFNDALRADFVEVAPDPVCIVCHRDAFVREELGMDAAQVEAEADALLDTIPSLPQSKT